MSEELKREIPKTMPTRKVTKYTDEEKAQHDRDFEKILKAVYDSLRMETDLRDGKEVLCSKCGKGMIVPVNKNVDPKDCHGFYCNNENCDYHLHWDPVVVIE